MKTGRILKKTGKILLITLLSLIVFILVVIGIALHSENTITRLALEEVTEMFDAPVKVDNVDLHITRNFPYATVAFEGLKVGPYRKNQKDTSDLISNDTLLSLDKLYVAVKSRPLLKNKIEIQKIEIEGFAFNYFVDSSGGTNIDFLMESDTTAVEEPDTVTTEPTESVLDVLLSNLTIRDVTINYKDHSMGAAALLHIPEMDISARVLDEYYKGALSGEVVLTNSKYNGTNLNLMNRTSLAFMVDYDDGAVELESLNFLTDGAKLTASGNAMIRDSIYMDMQFNLEDVNLKELSKYAPQEMLAEYGLKEIEGKLNLASNVKGYLYDTLLLPSVNTSIALKGARIITTDYPAIDDITFEGKILVPNPNDMQSMTADFKTFRLATPQSRVNASFNVKNFDQPKYRINTDAALTLDEFAALLPKGTVEYLKGNIDFRFSTHGTLPKNLGMNSADYFLARTKLDVQMRNIATAMDSVQKIENFSANFSYSPNKRMVLDKFTMEAPGYNVKIDNVVLMADILGLVSDMDNMGANVDSLYFKMGNTTLNAKAHVKGLSKPTFNLTSDLRLDLDELKQLMPDSLVDKMGGQVAFALKSHGTVDLDSIETQIMPIVFEQSEFGLNIANFNFAMPDDTLTSIDKLNLDFAMANDTMRIDNVHAQMHGLDFWLDSTEIWNVYKAFLLEQKDKKIIVNTHAKLSKFDYAMVLPFMEEDTTAADTSANTEIAENKPKPEAQPNTESNREVTKETGANTDTTSTEETYIPPYIVRGTFALNSVKYENIYLENLSTKFRVDDSLYVADKLTFDAFGGKIITSAVYDTRKDSPDDTLITVYFKNEMENVDIHQMLKDADNFDQEDFTYDNIRGSLTSSLDGRVILTDSFDVIYDKINVLGDFTLENGAIYNYEPLMEVSEYPVPALSDLDTLIFRTLNTNVFIYKNDIFFPKTDIISNKLDISAYGMQSFNEDYEYHFLMFFSDVIFGKNKKTLEDQGFESTVFEGNDEAKRRGTPIIAKDLDGETKYGPDSKAARRMMQTRIRLKERGLNLIFHPRLVNFSTDLDRKEGRAQKEEN
ncbi:AsmA family protein [Salinivirga cyanobacteriivorans]